jgi:hypothetical protein
MRHCVVRAEPLQRQAIEITAETNIDVTFQPQPIVGLSVKHQENQLNR